jgi:hypothetical protein
MSDEPKAMYYYKQVSAITESPHSDRPELAEMRKFMAVR